VIITPKGSKAFMLDVNEPIRVRDRLVPFFSGMGTYGSVAFRIPVSARGPYKQSVRREYWANMATRRGTPDT
jgi:hypothetical protein